MDKPVLCFSFLVLLAAAQPFSLQCGPQDGVMEQASPRVRLIKDGLPSATEGRVEVFHAGEFWRKAKGGESIGAAAAAGVEAGAEVGAGEVNWIRDFSMHGEWGTICSWGFDDDDAKAVCRGLGYGNGIHVMGHLEDGKPNPPFGEGSGRIWLEGVACQGHENNLFECVTDEWKASPIFGWGKVFYDEHKFDVGVKCS